MSSVRHLQCGSRHKKGSGRGGDQKTAKLSIFQSPGIGGKPPIPLGVHEPQGSLHLRCRQACRLLAGHHRCFPQSTIPTVGADSHRRQTPGRIHASRLHTGAHTYGEANQGQSLPGINSTSTGCTRIHEANAHVFQGWSIIPKIPDFLASSIPSSHPQPPCKNNTS